MKKSALFVLISTALVFGSMTTYANHHKGGESEKFEMEADVNNDGKVSFDEFKAAREKHMDEHFKRRDTNGDGFIDADERKAAKERRRAHHKGKCERK